MIKPLSTKVYTEGIPIAKNASPTVAIKKKYAVIGSHWTAAKAWREKTKEDHKAVLSLFLEIFGDLPADTIDKEVLVSV